jgi:hypothetical protein
MQRMPVCASPTRKRQHADAERRRRRLALYGLSMDEYERMAQGQDRRCAICGGTQSRVDSDGALVVNHDHVTGTIRGLLCTLCNTGLGAMRDDPAILSAAIRYLRAASAGSALS